MPVPGPGSRIEPEPRNDNTEALIARPSGNSCVLILFNAFIIYMIYNVTYNV